MRQDTLMTTQHADGVIAPKTLRLSVAGVGALAALTALLTFLPALLGIFSAWWPSLGFLLAVVSVLVLRVSTVRERRARIEAAFAEALEAERARTRSPRLEARELLALRAREQFFDAEQGKDDAEGPEAGSGKELPQPSSEKDQSPATVSGETWDPVTIPRPTYLDAPAATRHRPAPVIADEASKMTARTQAVQSVQQESARPQTGMLDLDVVLRRRRGA